jgi:hypothetical protein
MWQTGFLSVVAWHYVYGMKETVFSETDSFIPYTFSSCETATFIPYSAKQQHSETLSATSTGHYTICCKNLSLALLKMGKSLLKHVELILEINKTVIVASSWCSILLYLQKV